MKGSLQGCSPSHPSASMIDGHYYNPRNRKHRKYFGSGVWRIRVETMCRSGGQAKGTGIIEIPR